MSFNTIYLASSYLLILLGLAGLLLTRELSSPYLLLTGVAFALAVLAEIKGGRGILPKLLAYIIIVGGKGGRERGLSLEKDSTTFTGNAGAPFLKSFSS